MPDMDSPKISAAFFEKSGGAGSGGGGGGGSGGAAVKSLHLSKRPREETSPLPGKRGRGEHGDLLNLPIPHSTPLVTIALGLRCGNAAPPLLESPSKVNRASDASPTAFASFSAGVGNADKLPCKQTGSTLDALNSSGPAPARRKVFPPRLARVSKSATDPVFHAALLRLLRRRGGSTCPEALGWRWSGDAPTRFDHWPCALHPAVMDLLACVSAGEERVVLTGCDLKPRCDENPLPLQPPRPRRESPWQSPRGRGYGAQGGVSPVKNSMEVVSEGTAETTEVGAGAGSRQMSSPTGTPLPTSRFAASSVTPSSALRRPGGPPRSGNRVRFNTHDMSVVDTPHTARDGSEEGMVSALDGLQAILSAAEQVKILARRRAGTGAGAGATSFGSCCSDSPVESAQSRRFEGYFDRFSSIGRGSDGARSGGDCGENASGASASAVEPYVAPDDSENMALDKCSEAVSGTEVGASSPEDKLGDAALCGREGGGGGGERVNGVAEAPEAEAKNVREDVAALVTVLDEMASSDAAPGELTLAGGGWGPEHGNAMEFYAKELALLCGAGVSGDCGERASRLRRRQLDVLSTLVRYNLKVCLVFFC